MIYFLDIKEFVRFMHSQNFAFFFHCFYIVVQNYTKRKKIKKKKSIIKVY